MLQHGDAKRRLGALHGTILISVLAFVVVISLLLAGVLTIMASHYSRVTVEANYTSALDLAEAGINYELRKISQNATSADQQPFITAVGLPVGVGYTFGNGAFYVYCTNSDGTTPWITTGNNLNIISTGVLHGVTRSVMITAKSSSTSAGNYALYAVNSAVISNDTVVNGDFGTNNTLSSSAHTTINGTLWLNGPAAHATGNVTAIHSGSNSGPLSWSPVTSIAQAKFPGGGLTWLATHNDNALVSAIHTNQISSSGGTLTIPGKAGGANYYLTGMVFTGAAHLVLDNRLGPVTIWLGPDGASGTVSGNPLFNFQNTCSITTLSSSSANASVIYDSTTGPLTFQSDLTLTAGIYAYNVDASANPIGFVDCKKPDGINAPILANTLWFEGAGIVNVVNGFTLPGSVSYFGYDNQWSEINGM